MAAHPIEFFTPTADEDTFQVLPGTNMVCRVVLPAGSNVTVKLVHTEPTTQDYSLRCWFSTTPGGSSIVEVGPDTAFWHPRRKLIFAHALQNTAWDVTISGTQVYNIPSAPGVYYVNVLNLSNKTNRFFIDVDPIESVLPAE